MSFHISSLTSCRDVADLSQWWKPPRSGQGIVRQAASSPPLECQCGAHWEELDWKINDPSGSKAIWQPVSSFSTQALIQYCVCEPGEIQPPPPPPKLHWPDLLTGIIHSLYDFCVVYRRDEIPREQLPKKQVQPLKVTLVFTVYILSTLQ